MIRRVLATGILAAGAMIGGLSTPANAMIPVIDLGAITQLISQVTNTMNLVNSANQELRALPRSISVTNLQGRLFAVTAMLQQAQSYCQGAVLRKNVPSACLIRANTATVQASQLGAAMTTLTGLQDAARGSIGGLQAEQTTAHATLEVATQLMQLHQMQLAEQQQKTQDDAMLTKVYGAGTLNPW